MLLHVYMRGSRDKQVCHPGIPYQQFTESHHVQNGAVTCNARVAYIYVKGKPGHEFTSRACDITQRACCVSSEERDLQRK